MAVLEQFGEGGGDTAVVSAVRRQRRVGALFIGSVAWIVLIGLAAIFADWLPIASTTAGPYGQAVTYRSENHIPARHLGARALATLIHAPRIAHRRTAGTVIGVNIGGCLGMLAATSADG